MFKKTLLFSFVFFCFASKALAIGSDTKALAIGSDTKASTVGSGNKFIHPFYIGVTGGYGSTTWDGLVPSGSNRGTAMLLSTPVNVHEGGGTWGVFVGYEFIPFFALEASYNKYPNAKIFFDPMSLVAFENNGMTELNTSTDSVSVMGKIMLIIPHTDIRAYSSAGIARVHREDPLKESWRLSPSFGVGFNYNFTDHIMGELGANYTGGYGESEINPAEDFVPFLYSVFLRVAYRFG